MLCLLNRNENMKLKYMNNDERIQYNIKEILLFLAVNFLRFRFDMITQSNKINKLVQMKYSYRSID